MKLSLSFKNPLALIAVLLATHIAVAHGGGGHHGGSSHHGGGRGGRGGGRHKDICYGGDEAREFYNKTLYETALTDDCSADEFACPLRRSEEEGRFVCRTRFHPVTGERYSWPTCIPVDKAWDTDVCGCCGEACPDVTEGCVDSDSEDDGEPIDQGEFSVEYALSSDAATVWTALGALVSLTLATTVA